MAKRPPGMIALQVNVSELLDWREGLVRGKPYEQFCLGVAPRLTIPYH